MVRRDVGTAPRGGMKRPTETTVGSSTFARSIVAPPPLLRTFGIAWDNVNVVRCLTHLNRASGFSTESYTKRRTRISKRQSRLRYDRAPLGLRGGKVAAPCYRGRSWIAGVGGLVENGGGSMLVPHTSPRGCVRAAIGGWACEPTEAFLDSNWYHPQSPSRRSVLLKNSDYEKDHVARFSSWPLSKEAEEEEEEEKEEEEEEEE
uniref:Uncharacterized protein n=1 Tax=Vespula pensylvanica TaxID=30213 RepID=A0A834JNB1_VESPE|nr:hypothetical protein H0235_017773 [Vespula pensylvanica]